MERATGTEVYGCGSSQSTDITLNIQTTTGGNFSISLNGKNTVDHLKKLVSKKLKVAKDRICLLHRERQLREGTLEDNGLLDGARVILLPSVETGLLSQRPENSVMQALESLNDSQVNDFLSGKSPLNLTMRLGDHMMLIQLQLSTLNAGAGNNRSLRSTPRTSSTSCGQASLLTTKPPAKAEDKETPCPHITPQKVTQDEATGTDNDGGATFTLQKKDLELLHNAFELYRTMTQDNDDIEEKLDSADTTNCSISDLPEVSSNEQSPIKSLSNLVSCPIDESSEECIPGSSITSAELVNNVKNNLLEFISLQKKLNEETPCISNSNVSDAKPCQASTSISPDCTINDDSCDNLTEQGSFLTESTIDEYPMENLFNSAVDKGLFEDQDETMMDREISNLATTSHGSQDSNAGTLPSFQSINEPLKNKRFQYLLHKTSKFKHPIGQNKQKAFMQSVVNKHKKRMQNIQDHSTSTASRTEPYITNSRKLILQPSKSQPDDAVPSTSKQNPPFKVPDVPKKPPRATVPTPTIDTRALIEASQNLTQKLKKLSKEVLTNKGDHHRNVEETVRKLGSGAVIESMKHHGKGIYSGTFSGTLNPALQDRYGRPKRDISTIIHILNDLLCAAPPISIPKDFKNACTSTSDEVTKCICCKQPVCSHGKCDGHLPSTSEGKASCDHKDCPCSARREDETCSLCTVAGETCKRCLTAKMLAIENSKTKCKLEQLRLVMQQKKQRREARKLKTLPYTNPNKPISPDKAARKDEIESLA